MRPTRRVVATALVLVLAIVASLVIATVRRIESDPALGTPAPMAADLTPAEQRYVSYVEPRLGALQQESADLAALGESRSRDAVALVTGQRHVESLISEVSAFSEAQGIPLRFQPALAHFAEGAQEALGSIRAARAALARFDWETLGAEVERFSGAAERFASAERSLSQAAGDEDRAAARVRVGTPSSPR